MYVIPGCYLGNVSPKNVALPAGCDLSKLTTIRPRLNAALQQPKRREHLRVGEVGVAAARIRQHEHFSFADPLRLQAQRDRTFAFGKHRAIHRHADHRDHRRLEAEDLPAQLQAAGDVFRRQDGVDPRRRPRHDVGDPVAEFRQPIVVFEGDPLGGEAGLEQQLPESIRGPAK